MPANTRVEWLESKRTAKAEAAHQLRIRAKSLEFGASNAKTNKHFATKEAAVWFSGWKGKNWKKSVKFDNLDVSSYALVVSISRIPCCWGRRRCGFSLGSGNCAACLISSTSGKGLSSVNLLFEWLREFSMEKTLTSSEFQLRTSGACIVCSIPAGDIFRFKGCFWGHRTRRLWHALHGLAYGFYGVHPSHTLSIMYFSVLKITIDYLSTQKILCLWSSHTFWYQ